MFAKHFPTEINGNFTCAQKKSQMNSVGKLTCLWCCIISTLDPPDPQFHHSGLNDTSLLWSTWAKVCVFSWILIAVTRTMWISSQSEDVKKQCLLKCNFKSSCYKSKEIQQIIKHVLEVSPPNPICVTF